MFSDLPLHPLLAHAPVVLLPLTALGVIALAFMKRRSSQLVYAVLGLVVVAVVSTVATLLSGNGLAALMGFVPETHQRWGLFLTISAVVYLLVAGPWLWKVAREGDDPKPATKPLGYGAAAVGVVVTIFTVLAGHSGAEMAWSGVGAEAESSPASSTSADATYSLDDVAAHNTAADCWSVVDGKVYNLTDWVSEHPGGSGAIESMCGVDATDAFQGKHGGESGPEGALANYQIGTLADGTGSSTPAAGESSAAAEETEGYTAAQVAEHNTAEDCWVIINGNVYDLTQWVSQHPGGSGSITGMCGTDGTSAFEGKHGGESGPAGALEQFLLGPVS